MRKEYFLTKINNFNYWTKNTFIIDQRSQCTSQQKVLLIQVPYVDWWEMITSHKCTQAADAIFIHPGCNPAALAGNATIALERVYVIA